MAITLGINTHIGILGCGWLGSAIAKKLRKLNVKTTVFVRSNKSAGIKNDLGIKVAIYDACEVKHFPKGLSIDVLIITIPPSSLCDNKSYSDFIGENIVAGANEGIRKFVFTSSTSIYPSESGEYIETSELNYSIRAQTLINAENAIANLTREYIILRLGGLVDENRNPYHYSKQSKLFGNEPINMIYKDDAVDSILHLISKGNLGIFNAVAPIHNMRKDFYQSAFKQNSEIAIEMLEAEFAKNRIINPSKLLETGYKFKYPNPIDFPMKNTEI